MPKVGGGSVEKCMEICMGDEDTKKEYPSDEKRRDVCYAACNSKYITESEYSVEELIEKYKIKEIDVKELIKKYK